MEINRVKTLVVEYNLAKRRIEELRIAYDRAQISAEIAKDLEKDLLHEIKVAQTSKNAALVKYWEEIINACYKGDKDIVNKEDFEKMRSEFLAKNEKLILYYEKKIKIIKKFLGARLAQILENYEEKTLLMGGGEHSSTKTFFEIEEEEDIKDKKEKERKSSDTFDKM
jgi:hypothetical protein